MVKYENECVDCGLPCLGSNCPNRNVPRIYCDRCGEEIYEGDITEEYHLCDECKEQDTLIENRITVLQAESEE